MKSLSLISAGVFLTMNVATAAPEQLVSYHSTRVNGLEIFYREAGPKDAPTILLLHGLPSSSRMYQSLLESSLSEKYHLIAPDYPGFGHSSWPNPKDFVYTFDALAHVMQDFAEQLHLDRYTLFMQDYGGPVGFRMALAHPERVQAMIIQNAVSHEEGLSPLWAVRRAFWEDRPAHEAEVRNNLLSLEATRKRHVGTSPDLAQYNPDLWVDEYYFLNQPGQGDIQLDLFYDYQNNLKSYPEMAAVASRQQAAAARSLGTLRYVVHGSRWGSVPEGGPPGRCTHLGRRALCAGSEAERNHASHSRLHGKASIISAGNVEQMAEV